MEGKQHSTEDRFSDLRRKAEELIRPRSQEGGEPAEVDMPRLIHELEVHQIELEMQNEELVHTQVKLEKSRDRYIDLYDFAPVGYLTLDEKGIILEANLTVSSLLGVERNKLVKQQLANFVFKEDQDLYYFFRKKLAGSHGSMAEDLRLGRPVGGPFYARLEGLISPGESGELICHLSISDVSRQKAAENGLVETKERFRIMSDFTQDWEYWISPKKEFVYISPSCEAISGYRAEEFYGDADLISNIVHPDDQKAWQNHEAIFFHSGQPGSLDLRILTRSGRVRWIHHLCQPVYDRSGKWLGRRASNRDISDRKIVDIEREKMIYQLRSAREIRLLLLRRLMEAEENERRVIARELHDEVGQALTALKINLQMVQRRQNNNLELAESISLVEHTLEQVRKISRNLPPTVLEDLGLAPALRWLLEKQGGAAGLSTSFVSTLVEARYAPDIEIACFRVAQEALTNIMRHSQAHQVKLELFEKENELHLTIQDDGCGFDVEMAYVQAGQGSSLGLIGMRERVSLTGGHMEIESNQGQGTTIRVSFPLVQ
jgi:PAS domain S-box-containing protein